MIAATLLLSLSTLGPTSPSLQVRVDSAHRAVVLTISQLDIPAGMGGGHHSGMHAAGGELPLLRFAWPVTGWARGAAYTLSGRDGARLSRGLVHHINVVNFARRQLFYPTPERLLAMGQETEDIRLPASVGVPVTTGMPMGVVAAFHNEEHTPITGVTLELRIEYSPSNLVPRPVSVLPAYLDVQDPVGRDVDFDLPAGPTSWTADFDMPLSGRIIGAGGHLHDFGTALRLLDVSTAKPREVLTLNTRREKDGKVLSVERSLPGVTGNGLRLEQHRRYRLVGEYQNTTGAAITKGAMVHLILLFVPEKPEEWPRLNQGSAEYRKDVDRLEAMGRTTRD